MEKSEKRAKKKIEQIESMLKKEKEIFQQKLDQLKKKKQEYGIIEEEKEG